MATSGASSVTDFYPRSPCGERRAGWPSLSMRSRFLSTLSLRRATVSCNYFPFDIAISIHALLAESDNGHVQYCIRARISIHALLAESDRAPPYNLIIHHDFYPRSPCGERQAADISARRDARISIHALLAESDGNLFFLDGQDINFYPRSPCGERPQGESSKKKGRANFYPRSPCGERHVRCFSPAGCWRISIHALLAESDV